MAKKETKTDKIELEREYVIPLRKKTQKVPRYKKSNKAIKTIKEFLVKHMKIRDRDLNKIKIDKYLNEFVWFRGIKKPPAKVKVKAIKQGEIVRVELFELPDKLKFKKLREEKKEKIGEEKKKLKSPAKEEEEKQEINQEKDSEKQEKSEQEKKSEAKEKLKSEEELTGKIAKNMAKKSKHEASAKSMKSKRPQRKALAK